MSYEYFGTPTPTPSLTVESIQQTVDAVIEVNGISLVRREEPEYGISFTENKNPEDETATITLQPDQIYVAFHACHVHQIEKVLQHLESTLKLLGYECRFEEE